MMFQIKTFSTNLDYDDYTNLTKKNKNGKLLLINFNY